MSQFLLKLSLVFSCMLVVMVSKAQCDMDAGLYCDPTVENGAPILCDIDCLDGFIARMPDTLYEPQPGISCNGEGNPNNMSWFAFVAGSDSIALTVTPSNCSVALDGNGSPLYRGIQAGLMSDCEDILACYSQCREDGLTATPAVIAVGGLIPGQTYYFYVDGCGGSQCDYEVAVDYGNQPFAIDEPDNIYSSVITMSGDTVCTGIDTVDFTLVGVDTLIDYNWRIMPATDSMPDRDSDGWGELVAVDQPTISLPFATAGDYTIMAWADNDCDQTDSIFFSFTVADLAPFVFDSVEICVSDFPFIGPFQDGLGWMSGPIFAPGFYQETVTMENGCFYEESVYVSTQGGTREDITLATCSDSYPIALPGSIIINSAADGGFYTLGIASDGCDSLVNVIIEEQQVYGQLTAGDCGPGTVDIAFRLDSTAYPVDSITYQWLDGAMTPLVDGTQSTLTANVGNNYFVEVTTYRDGVSCTDIRGPLLADGSSFQLNPPSFVDPDLDICPDEAMTQYTVATDGLEDTIWWYLPTSDLTWFEINQSTANVNWSSMPDAMLCTYTSSSCGRSDTTCITVSRLVAPMVEYMIDDTVCAAEQALATYTGDPGLSLQWNSGSASFVDLGSDQFGFTWPTPGDYQVALTGTDGNCSDTAVVRSIHVQSESIAPQLSCTGGQGSITVEWGSASCITDYVLDTNGVVLYTGPASSYVLEGLSNGQEVSFNLGFTPDCGCYTSTAVSTTCTATPCDPVQIDIDGVFGQMCSDDIASVITYDALVSGSTSATGEWLGPFISPEGIVQVDSLADGVHTFYYQIVDGACFYEDSISLEIFDSPQLIIDVDNPDCYDDSTGMVSVDAVGGSGPYTFFINGYVTDDLDDMELLSGDYMVEVLDDNACGDNETVEITVPNQPGLMIFGPGDIVEGGSDQLSINTSAFVGHVIDSILWQGDPGGTLCEGCAEISVSPDLQTSYLVTVFFDDGCSVEETYLLSVRPETQIAWSNVINPQSPFEENRTLTLGSNVSLDLDYLVIYDRWGELVYSLSEQVISGKTQFWDGTYRGQPAQQGVYVMSFKVSDGEQIIERTGTITVVR